MYRTSNALKKCDGPFESFLGNDAAKQRVGGWFEVGRLPHALFITAPDGCGRNEFARLIAAAYLQDTGGLIPRGVHPDCLVVAGEGASGNIPVKRIRALAYDLHMAAVMADGRRVALLRDVKNLNKNSANALLKILEEPPAGVIFLLTAAYSSDILETVRSRCAEVSLSPLSGAQCADAAAQRFPRGDRERVDRLAAAYGGRLGMVLKTLSAPELLALNDAARRFCDAAVLGDKLAALIELENAANREALSLLLRDAAFYLRLRLKTDNAPAPAITKAADAVSNAREALERYMPPKLAAAQIATQL